MEWLLNYFICSFTLFTRIGLTHAIEAKCNKSWPMMRSRVRVVVVVHFVVRFVSFVRVTLLFTKQRVYTQLKKRNIDSS